MQYDPTESDPMSQILNRRIVTHDIRPTELSADVIGTSDCLVASKGDIGEVEFDACKVQRERAGVNVASKSRHVEDALPCVHVYRHCNVGTDFRVS